MRKRGASEHLPVRHPPTTTSNRWSPLNKALRETRSKTLMPLTDVIVVVGSNSQIPCKTWLDVCPFWSTLQVQSPLPQDRKFAHLKNLKNIGHL